MPKKTDNNLIVGLDIGTSKVVVIVGETMLDGNLEIVGIGSHPSRGMKKGAVVDIDATVRSISRAVEEAELMAGCQIHSVFTGIAGSHIRSLNSHGIVAVRNGEVDQDDIDRVIDAAKAMVIPENQKILHILPREFIIDYQEGIHEPMGMSGVRLEAKVHMVTGAVSAAQNIVNSVRRCGLEVDDIILEQLASSCAVLTEDEKRLGVCMIDIGGGTTDIAVFSDGAIYHTGVIPVAGDQVTNDIAIALRTATQNAEMIKIQYGVAMHEFADKDQIIDVSDAGDKNRAIQQIRQSDLADVIEPRFDELFSLVMDKLTEAGLVDMLGAGIVLTGGSSKLRGIIDLAEDVFHLPVRLGVPREISGLSEVVKNPIFATGIGLLLYGRKRQTKSEGNFAAAQGMRGIVGRIRNWFQGNF